MAGEQRYTVDIGVTGLSSLNKLQTNIDGLQRRMMGLKSIIASGLFAGLGAGALRMADDLQDLANSTGIATARLLEFKKALSDNGGQIDQMAQGVTTFVRSIDEAAQGSLKAQNTFRELNITMTDLRTLGEQELMVKALKGIGNIENASRRAAIMTDLFGKSFRTVDAKGLAADLERTAGNADAYAQSIKRGAELNDALAQAAGTVKLAFLEAFSPIIEGLNKFNTATAEGSAKMEMLIAGIKLAGATLVTAFAASILVPIVSSIGVMLRGISAIGVAVGSSALPAWLIASTGAAARFLPALRAISLLFAAGLGIYTAIQLFDDFGSIALNILSKVAEKILDIQGTILNLPTDAIAKIANFFGADIKDMKGLGTPFLMARDALEEYRKKQEEAALAAKKLKEEAKKTSDASKEQAAAINRTIDTSAFDNAAAGVRKIGEAYKENGRRILENLELETKAIGKSKESQELQTAQAALVNRTTDAVQQLRDAQATMSKELKDAGLGKVYDQEIAKVQELARVESERLTALITNLNKAKAAEELRLFGIKSQYDMEDKLLAIQREMADLTLTDIEKKYRDIARSADDSAKAAIRAEEARRGAPLNTQEIEEYYKRSRAGIDSVVSAQRKLNAESRTFATGWKKAWADYTENATNAAQAATRLFEKFTQGIEDSLVDFAKTGKFEWKNFVAGMAEELLRSQIKQTLASVLQIGNPFSSTGGSVGGGIGDLFGSLLGGGGGATKGQSANNPMYVLDVAGGGGGPGGIGNLFGGNNPLQGPTQSGGNLSGGGFFDSITSGIGKLFGGGSKPLQGPTPSGGNLSDNGFFSGIGDFFSGFFANGGNIPAGQFGMVGERGPELIGGPATITPMAGSSNVTYNIQAVDARSFQQLLASDPSFIFALTEQGRKSFAGAR